MNPPASTLCNISCSEWHGCTGMHKTIQLAKQRLCGTQAVLFLHNPFDADFTVVRVGINTVIVQHSLCMIQLLYDTVTVSYSNCAQYFDAERPITPFEIIPRVRTGPPLYPRSLPRCLNAPAMRPSICLCIQSIVHLFTLSFSRSFNHSHVLLASSADINMCINYVY